MQTRMLTVTLALSLAGCAGSAHQTSFNVPLADPNEATNRVVADVQSTANRIVVRPVNHVYEAVVPAVARDRLTAARRNLDEPRIFVNNVLQGRLGAANLTMGRFLGNSIFGIGGLFDIATAAGAPRQTGDFGQTLHVWGFQSGDYLVLPFLGPSTPRDAVGRVVDMAMDPVGWTFFLTLGTPNADFVTGGLAGFDIVEQGRQLDEIEKDSLDPYARMKSLWEQNRASELRKAFEPANGSETR